MTTRPQSCGPPSAAQDVANLGLIRPPLVYLTSLVSGAVIQLATPFPFLPGTLAVSLGAPLVVVAITLFAYSVTTFRAAGTPVPARKPTTMIVRTGPYRFSRNPIYLAFSLLQFGISIWVNSVWLLATLAGAVRSFTTSSYAEKNSIWNGDSVRSTWTIRRPCAAGCKPPNQRLQRAGA